MTSLKLNYFNVRARGEPTRLTMVMGGIEFDDNRISDWPKFKPSTPYGSLPTLEVEGVQMAQSAAILRYVGRLAGMYPTCSKQALQVDELLDTLSEIYSALFAGYGAEPEVARVSRKKFVEEVIPRYAGALNKRLAKFGEGAFAVGSKFSIADVVLACLVNDISSGHFDYVPTDLLDGYARIMASHKEVMSCPKVTKWHIKHPITKKEPKLD